MQIRSICCKLITTQVLENDFALTSIAYANACNDALVQAIEHKIRNANELHKIVYKDLRVKFNLSANLTVRVIRRVCGSMVKRKKRCAKKFKPGSVDYDARIFSLREKDWTVTLKTINGRPRVALDLGEYQKNALIGKKVTSAKLVKKGKEWYFHICIEEPIPKSSSKEIMGVDLGIRNIFATSTGLIESGHERQKFKEKRACIRSSLQSKNTRGSKKKLKRLSGYEDRYIRHQNHVLSKEIINEAKRHNVGIIRMERLKGIRDRCKIWNKHNNRAMAGWSFYQLQQFVQYKSKIAGMTLELIDPAYTSKTCSQCYSLGNRDGDLFICTTCGISHADLNAARVIAKGGANVSWPKLTMALSH